VTAALAEHVALGMAAGAQDAVALVLLVAETVRAVHMAV
jgi:hypothetical protein